MAAARGPQAGGDLPSGARGPADRRVVVVVVDLPAVDRRGAMLRHAVRDQHQAVLVRRRAPRGWFSGRAGLQQVRGDHPSTAR